MQPVGCMYLCVLHEYIHLLLRTYTLAGYAALALRCPCGCSTVAVDQEGDHASQVFDRGEYHACMSICMYKYIVCNLLVTYRGRYLTLVIILPWPSPHPGHYLTMAVTLPWSLSYRGRYQGCIKGLDSEILALRQLCRSIVPSLEVCHMCAKCSACVEQVSSCLTHGACMHILRMHMHILRMHMHIFALLSPFLQLSSAHVVCACSVVIISTCCMRMFRALEGVRLMPTPSNLP
jgi:hypothetical protein